MRRQNLSRRHLNGSRFPARYTPSLFNLEDRVAPGDALLGLLLAGVGTAAAIQAAEPSTPATSRLALVDPKPSDPLRAAPSATQEPTSNTTLVPNQSVPSMPIEVAQSQAFVGMSEPILVDPLLAADLFANPQNTHDGRSAGASVGLGTMTRSETDSPMQVSAPSSSGVASPPAVAPQADKPVIHNMPNQRPSQNGSRNIAILRNYPPECEECECEDGGTAPADQNCPSENPSGTSDSGVRYADGTTKQKFGNPKNMASNGFGKTWGHGQTWSNIEDFPTPAYAANGAVVNDMPFLQQVDGLSDLEIAIIFSPTSLQFFDYDSGSSSYQSRFFNDATALIHDDTNDEFLYADSAGNQMRFHDFTVTGAEGWLIGYTTPDGNSFTVNYSGDQITSLVRTGTGWEERYAYSYYGSGNDNEDRLHLVTLERRVLPSGSWSDPIRQIEYVYYEDSESHGNVGDLKYVNVMDGNDSILEISYYRYYESSGSDGFESGLKYVFEPKSFARLLAANDIDLANFTAVEDLVEGTDPFVEYADLYLKYGPASAPTGLEQAVKEVVVQGAGCSSCTGGQGTYKYSFIEGSGTGFNEWAMETTETLPDHVPNTYTSQNIIYTNEHGQVILRVELRGAQQWLTHYHYDGMGNVDLIAHPSAMIDFDDTTDALVDPDTDINQDTGLIEQFSYYGSTSGGIDDDTAGDVKNFFEEHTLHYGMDGTAVKQRTVQYYAHSFTVGSNTLKVYPVATVTTYRDGDTEDVTTTNHYDDWESARVMTTRVTYPAVGTSQNGPNTSVEETTDYDEQGRVVEFTDGDGYVTTYEYDEPTGAMTEETVDVGGTGHLNLVTTLVVDTLGRTTKRNDPRGNITYTFYNDVDHEVRTYRGWLATHTTTGPIEVYREHRHADPSYVETLTMWANEADYDSQTDEPLGTDDFDDADVAIHSLTRTFTDAGGQVPHIDSYVSLNGNPYETDETITGATYHRTTFGYDERGRRNRVLRTTGTIERTVYDGMGRAASKWIGTNDTENNDDWTPSDPDDLVKVREFIYDSYGSASDDMADGNLTKVIDFPGGSADDRITHRYFDWRNRLVATKTGATANPSTEDDTVQRSISYVELDNYGLAVVRESYDGDELYVVDSDADGVPDRPMKDTDADGDPDVAAPEFLRSKTATSYDDRQRVFRTEVFSVDPSDGEVSEDALVTDVWYDLRGNVIKESPPGGLVTKYLYDGAGRLSKTFKTDGGGDDEWSEADDVVGDNVLEQVHVRYDVNDNDILATTKKRYDPVTLAAEGCDGSSQPTTGELGSPTACPKARVSYTMRWYDRADRLTAQADYGTNAGSNPGTPPTSPPTRDDTHLVTSYGFKADEVQVVSLVDDPTGDFTLSFGGYTTDDDILVTDSASTVQTELEQLTSIGTGNVLVRGPAGGPWVVRFVGTLGEKNVAQLTADDTGLSDGTIEIITTSEGGDTGRVQKVTDPRAFVTKTDYDMLGRSLRTVEAFTDFNPSDGDDRTTEYTYDGSGHVLTLTAMLPDNGLQRTEYVYGVTTGAGSDVNSNDLLATVKYPDKSSGLPSTSVSDQEGYTYNALGQITTKIDRNQNATEEVGTTHAFSYDVIGRTTSEAITVLGDGLDDTVLRHDTAYDTAGRASLFTSCDSASTCTSTHVVNQVLRQYNGLGQLTAEYQEQTGEVDTDTSLRVRYTYSEMSESSSYANHSRLKRIIYPDVQGGAMGRTVNFVYSSGLDNTISRVSSLTTSSTTLEQYAYLGLDTVVKRTHPDNSDEVGLTYLKQSSESNGEAGDPYNGLDRFGRVIDQRWIDSGSVSTPLDRFQYGYDRNSSRMYRENLIDADFSELYHANGSSEGYDNFNQLTDFSRGEFTSGKHTIGSPDRELEWELDATGNWESLATDSGSPVTREHNKQNQVIEVGSDDLAFDDNGNTTTDETGNTLVYDAWNRLVSFDDGTATVTYAYDASGRRTERTLDSVTTGFFYSDQWQVLEERVSGNAHAQYVWSPVYIDALIVRDRDADSSSGNGLEERVFVMQDANFNVTAIANAAGTVLERYVYDPYGTRTRLTASWGTPSSDPYNWVYLHQGGRYEAATGLYNFRMREYSPTLGRWMQVDPLGYRGLDLNLYRYETNSPGSASDPLGWSSADEPKIIFRPTPEQKKKDEAKKKCEQWAAKEEKADKSWLKRLPPCPCCVSTGASDATPKVPKDAKGAWFEVEEANQTYHPGAKWCVRSQPQHVGGPGQQCCYDKEGKLLTHGPGAGTPDKVAPVGLIPGILDHKYEDVDSYFACKEAGMLDVYLKYRPPNQGSKPFNPNEIFLLPPGTPLKDLPEPKFGPQPCDENPKKG